MPSVELIYDHNCPNADDARKQLKKAFATLGVSPTWREWEQHDSNGPDYIRKYGSPTILVGGKDVTGAAPGKELEACRIYRQADGTTSGAPPLEKIVSALEPIARHWPKERKSIFALITGAVSWLVVLFPKAACPA